MKFGLTDQQWSILEKEMLSPCRENHVTIWIFGSRARGDHREFSDLDVLYQEGSPLPPGLVSGIREKLEDSRLPFKVDLVNIEDLATSYTNNVLKERVLVP